MILKMLMLRRDVTTLARPACVAAAPEQSPLGSLKVACLLHAYVFRCAHARTRVRRPSLSCSSCARKRECRRPGRSRTSSTSWRSTAAWAWTGGAGTGRAATLATKAGTVLVGALARRCAGTAVGTSSVRTTAGNRAARTVVDPKFVRTCDSGIYAEIAEELASVRTVVSVLRAESAVGQVFAHTSVFAQRAKNAEVLLYVRTSASAHNAKTVGSSVATRKFVHIVQSVTTWVPRLRHTVTSRASCKKIYAIDQHQLC